MKKSWAVREELKCPHCGFKSKNHGNMNRYHFDNCKKNPNYKPKLITCPNCGFSSTSERNMKRWHFENCKSKNK